VIRQPLSRPRRVSPSEVAERVESWPSMTVHRMDYIADVCSGKRVLHVGCADDPQTIEKLRRGNLLHGRLSEVAQTLYGIDSSSDAIETLRAAGFDNLAVADIEAIGAGRPFSGVSFDVVVAGEVIEHLSNPGLFLEGVKHYLRDGCSLLVTTVNAYCAHRFLYTLLRDRESVSPDHTMYFSRRTLVQLATRHGYAIEELRFYAADEYEEHLNRGRFRVLWWTDRLAARWRPVLAEGLVALLALGHEDGADEREAATG
jgi:2-polyprenyl-3-methyl-5-hydroxy-6-metoxy-1,4-benzoquinol methylase